MSETPEYSGYISDEYIKDLYRSAILHDIGKVGIPDRILLKNDKLSDTEYLKMQEHTLLGGDTIKNIETRIKIKSFLTLGREIAYSHHEKWDGSGYPKGLKGDSIPLSARIVAVADVYDALTSERPYKRAFTHEQAHTIILNGERAAFRSVHCFCISAGRGCFQRHQ